MNIVVCASAKSSAGKSSLTMLMAQMWRHRHSVAVIDLNQSPQAYDWADALNISAAHWPDVTAPELKTSLCRLSADIVLIDVPSVKNSMVGSIIEISNLILLPFQPSQGTLCAEQLAEILPRSIKENHSPTIVAVPYLAHSRQTQALSDVSTGPFKIHYAPPIHRWIEIERGASTYADFYEPYPFSKAGREILDCSQFVLRQLRNHRSKSEISTNITGFGTEMVNGGNKPTGLSLTEREFPVKLTVRLSRETHSALRRLAFDEKRSINDILRQLLDRHLDSQSTSHL